MEEWLLNDLFKNFDISHYYDKTKVNREYNTVILRRINGSEGVKQYLESDDLIIYKKELEKKGINLMMNEYPDNKYVSLRKLVENCIVTSDIEFANIFELKQCPALFKIINHDCEDEWVESETYNQIMVRYYKLTPGGKIHIKQKIYKKVENIKKGFGYLVDNLYSKPYNIEYCASCYYYNMNIFIPYNSKGFIRICALEYYNTLSEPLKEDMSKFVLSMCDLKTTLDIPKIYVKYEIKDWYCHREMDNNLLKENTYYD